MLKSYHNLQFFTILSGKSYTVLVASYCSRTFGINIEHANFAKSDFTIQVEISPRSYYETMYKVKDSELLFIGYSQIDYSCIHTNFAYKPSLLIIPYHYLQITYWFYSNVLFVENRMECLPRQPARRYWNHQQIQPVRLLQIWILSFKMEWKYYFDRTAASLSPYYRLQIRRSIHTAETL